MSNPSNDKLAVLIDADNAEADIAKELLDEISRYGIASVKRIYGDWTTPNLKPWKEELHKWAIQPIQQFAYTNGKNSTDSALIIDAMDLLHAEKLDGFCIVSSDSDYTRLATRIRESGLKVYGFGEHKTPKSFIAACDKFIDTAILRPPPPSNAQTVHSPKLSVTNFSLEQMMREAIAATERDEGWASLGAVGSQLNKTNPAFDSRSYGFPKLSELVREQNYLEIGEVSTGEGSANVHLYVRLKTA